MTLRNFIYIILVVSWSGLHINCSAFLLDDLSKLDYYLNSAVPTIRSSNIKCRNHSILYLEELKQLKLWATEMFDSSSKFPTGILSGVTFDFGNFDECIDVKVTLSDGEKLQGRHCMAKFHISPPEHVKKDRRFHYQYYDSDNFLNTSTWEKIVDFYNDRTRTSRNDFYYSFCIPSSCDHYDLETSLSEMVDTVNSIHDFRVSVSVDPRHCQIKTNPAFTIGDISFMCVIAFFVMIVLSATFYDWLMKLKELQHLRLTGKKQEILMAFSLWSNLKKLAKDTQNEDRLQCISGMKVFSMFLIIMGHRIMFGIGSPIINSNYIESMYGRVETTVLLNGPIIVDTFFNISGFLASYLMLQQFDKIKNGFQVFYMYLHRFIRLTPVYAVVVGFYCTIFIKLGSGPLWKERMEVEQERCLNSWWANLLYVNNYVNKENLCMFQSWYMACDFHLFLTTPLFVWLLRKKPTIGIFTLLATIIASICTVFAVVYVNNEDGILLLYMKLLRNPVATTTFQNIYIPTHMRASPYFVGILTGYLKYQMRSKGYKMPNYMVYVGWVCCILIIEFTVYAAFIFYIPGKPYDRFLSAIYACTHHFTFSLCISWMIITISEGYGSWVEPILSWKPFALLSRITYSAFLCHGAIQLYSAAILRQPNYCEVFYVIFNTAGDIALAYILGLMLSLFFEAPIVRLEKFIFNTELRKKSKEIKIEAVLNGSKIKTIT